MARFVRVAPKCLRLSISTPRPTACAHLLLGLEAGHVLVYRLHCGHLEGARTHQGQVGGLLVVVGTCRRQAVDVQQMSCR